MLDRNTNILLNINYQYRYLKYLTKYERDQYLAKLNIDDTNSGIPTSQTPINKKKIIPNSRKKTDNKIGGQINHRKHKLEKFEDDEINEHEDVILEECPHCHSKKLVELESEITKDEFDYQIKIKVSEQFQNISNAEYYAVIRSYIETCYKNNVNGHEALIRLIQDNPYTLDEILEMGKKRAKKKRLISLF